MGTAMALTWIQGPRLSLQPVKNCGSISNDTASWIKKLNNRHAQFVALASMSGSGARAPPPPPLNMFFGVHLILQNVRNDRTQTQNVRNDLPHSRVHVLMKEVGAWGMARPPCPPSRMGGLQGCADVIVSLLKVSILPDVPRTRIIFPRLPDCLSPGYLSQSI